MHSNCAFPFPFRIEQAAQSHTLSPGPLGPVALTIPARWVYITTNLGGQHCIEFGDSTVTTTTTTAWACTNRDRGLLLNVSGHTHFATDGTGGGGFLIAPVVPQRRANMMTPPAVQSVTNIDTTATANTALPVLADGQPPRIIMLTQSSATALAIQLGYSGTAVGATAPMLYVNSNSPVVLNCAGFTHISTAAVASNTLNVAAIG